MPCNALFDAAASPDVLIRRERAEPIEEEDGGKKGRRVERRGRKKEKERERRWAGISNGSEKLFRYDRNLRTRPAAGIRTSRTTRLLLRSISHSSRSRRPGRYATLIRHLRGRREAESDMRAGTSREIARVCLSTLEDWRVTSKVTPIAYIICITRGQKTDSL